MVSKKRTRLAHKKGFKIETLLNENKTKACIPKTTKTITYIPINDFKNAYSALEILIIFF